MNAQEELALLLRPAGGGVFLLSTGKADQLALQQRIYGAKGEAEVREKWLSSLGRLRTARAVVLGVPSDAGAGYVRGANQGPAALRGALLETDPALFTRPDVVDLGDVFTVPQLLQDELLSERQKERTRAALYPDLSAAEAARLPVSPLSMAERVLDLVFSLAPAAKPLVLGGDHSVAWPVVAALHRARPGFGITQSDAHTDLLEERLGIRICFATWSFHANELLGRGGRLVQLGIRATRHDRGYWESTLGVRQFWAEECLARGEAVIDEVIAHFKKLGVRGVYFSNDIDGTDSAFADATGTPEPGGLTPDFVAALVRRLGAELGLVGGDLVEVAPVVACSPGGRERTLAVSARYLRETLLALLSDAA
jgi:agmatinase